MNESDGMKDGTFSAVILCSIVAGIVMALLSGQWVVGVAVAVAIPICLFGLLLGGILIGGSMVAPFWIIKKIRKLFN